MLATIPNPTSANSSQHNAAPNVNPHLLAAAAGGGSGSAPPSPSSVRRSPAGSASNLPGDGNSGGGGGGGGGDSGGGGGGSGDASTKPVFDYAAAEVAASEEKLRKVNALLEAKNVNMEELRDLSWNGVPPEVRPSCWKLLCGYLPSNRERQATTLARKRGEYAGFVEQYYPSRLNEQNQALFRQIHIDVPRTNPSVPLFQHVRVQETFERILYIWAIRHPASGYVQGINDLLTPFFAVFLTEHVSGDPQHYNIDDVSDEQLAQVEADTFWCVGKLLDGIQDNYTYAQPGIQRKIAALRELVSRIDVKLNAHLEAHGVEYLQFAFRWMNCLLMREMPLRCTIRMWDTYQADGDGFATFHLYVCAAFLVQWSRALLEERDFQVSRSEGARVHH